MGLQRKHIAPHAQNFLSLVGNKWAILVLCTLQSSTLRYNVIEKTVPNITQRALTMTLRGLERNGMVERIAYPTIPPQVEYKLTPLGLEVLKICESLADWAEKHAGEIKRAQKAYVQSAKG